MDSMGLLNYGWRNYLSAMMGLDPATFQLAQGTLGLQTSDSSGLFLMADAVPPVGSVHFYDSSSMNKRSSAYSVLLSALLPETNPNALANALGDQYAAWIKWKAANPPTSGETYLALFQRWASQSNADPGVLAAGETSIMAVQQDPLLMAYMAYTNPAGQQSFVSPSGSIFTLPIYSTTHQAATDAIAGSGASIPRLNFDSGTIAPHGASTSRLAAMTSLAGPVRFFGGIQTGVGSLRTSGVGNRLTQLNTDAPAQRVTIVGRVGSYATLASSPGSWYASGEVSRAWKGKGNGAIWDAGVASGGWESFFDPTSGSLARYVSQLILISDYQLTVTVYGQFTQSDVILVRNAAIRGAWPLFSSAEPPTHNVSYRINSDASMSLDYQLDAGKIQIWGVSVQGAGALGG